MIVRDKNSPRGKIKNSEIDSQTEMMLVKTFETLLRNEVLLEEKRRALWDTPGFQERP